MEAYLTHHGVKGMKWGVRKEKLKSVAKKSAPVAKTVAIAGASAAVRVGVQATTLAVTGNPTISKVAGAAASTSVRYAASAVEKAIVNNKNKKISELM